MNIRDSLGWKIFLLVLAAFLAMLGCQWLFLRNDFTAYFARSYQEELQRELAGSAAAFAGDAAGELQADAALFAYMRRTGNPVFVFDEEWRVCDRGLFDQISSVTVKTGDNRRMVMPLYYVQEMRNLSGSLLSIFSRGRVIDINAVRLGASDYYDPMILAVNDVSYTNRQNVRAYKQSNLELEIVDAYGWIVSTRYVSGEQSGLDRRAVLLYENVRQALALRQDIETFLAALTAAPVMDAAGKQFFFFSETRRIDGRQVYFVTLHELIDFSGFSKYAGRYTYWNYLLLFVLLVCGSYLLSRWLSKPMTHLSQVTTRIAALDFSAQADIRSRDELGRLAENINQMSASLETALGELRRSNSELATAAARSHENELRLNMLLTDLAHEFKTPLGVVSGYCQVLENELCEPEKRAYYFQVIDGEIDRLTMLVDEVTELSKLSSGYWPMQPQPVELGGLIRGMQARFAVALAREHFTLDCAVPNEIWVTADARRIEQVFNNLLSNAMKYAGADHLIQLSVRRAADAQALVELRNSGTIAATDMEKIWQRYYRAPEAARELRPGVGIGLEIVRNILILHHSEFGVRQEPGGVCFFFTLPLAGEQEAT